MVKSRLVQWSAVAVCGCFILAGSAYCQSFDCRKAGTVVERLICSDPELSSLDESLARAYKSVRNSGLVDKGQLKADQVKWLRQRDRCRDADCLRAFYTARTAELEAYTARKIRGSETNFTGTYEPEGMDGELRILHMPDGRIQFYVYATWLNSITGVPNIGSLTGTGQLKGNTLVYTDRENDCRLTIKFGQNRVSITQKGFCGFGMNVTADGEYVRTNKNAPSFSDIM